MLEELRIGKTARGNPDRNLRKLDVAWWTVLNCNFLKTTGPSFLPVVADYVCYGVQFRRLLFVAVRDLPLRPLENGVMGWRQLQPSDIWFRSAPLDTDGGCLSSLEIAGGFPLKAR